MKEVMVFRPGAADGAHCHVPLPNLITDNLITDAAKILEVPAEIISPCLDVGKRAGNRVTLIAAGPGLPQLVHRWFADALVPVRATHQGTYGGVG
jgi:hypothetical protein